MKLKRSTVREYVESFTVAFILAMIIRHYVVEAFRIPTSSMEPTLIGREPGGDRILVNKFEFALHKPKPWEIVVFKLDQNRITFHQMGAPTQMTEMRMRPNGTVSYPGSPVFINYVKRLIGLPGQTIQVRNGDVFIDGRISRKPLDMLDDILIPVTNDRVLKDRGENLSDRWESSDAATVSVRDDSLAMTGTLRESNVRYKYQIEDRVDTDFNGTRRRESSGSFNLVGEVMLKFHVKHAGGTGYVTGMLAKNGTSYTFVVPFGKSESAKILRDDEIVASSDASINLSGEHDIKFTNVDARAALIVDGRPVVVYESAVPQETEADKVGNSHRQRSIVQFGVIGCDAKFSNVALLRDIFYTSDPMQQRFAVAQPLKLGDDEYFMLGDNSPNSFDSRNWGVVKRAQLVGDSFFVFWPLLRLKFI